MTRRSIIFLGTAASVPQQDKLTQSIAICGSKECALLDAGEGVQIRLSSAGIDHRNIKIISITHIHGDHIHGLLPFIETLRMKLSTQKILEKHLLKILAPSDFCRYLDIALDVIAKSIKIDEHLDITCIDSESLNNSGSFVESPSREIRITSVPVKHGICNSYGYYANIDLGKDAVGIFYSGDGICDHVCMGKLKHLKPDIVIHEATFLDYLDDSVKAYESYHSTVYEAAKIAQEVGALALVLTHISGRYKETYLRDFVSRARRVFQGSILVAEDLAKIPFTLLTR